MSATLVADRTRRQAAAQEATTARERWACLTAHISPRPVITYAVGGTYNRLEARDRHRSQVGSGRRGAPSGFSRQSRRRFMDTWAKINRPAVADIPLVVTLTYPDQFPTDAATHKRHLDSFGKALLRRHPRAAAIWVVELQQRGAPHYHLAVIGVPRLDKDWLSQTWYRIVGSGDERHLRAGTQVQRMRSWGGAQNYLAKYLSKGSTRRVDPATGEIVSAELGRVWGVIGRANLPVELKYEEIVKTDFWKLRRIFARCYSKRARRYQRRRTWQGMRVYCSTEQTVRLLARGP